MAEIDLDNFLCGTVLSGIQGPDASERMTATERKALSAKIIAAASALRDALKPLLGEPGSVGNAVPFEFQALFDSFALDVATDNEDTLKAGGVVMDKEVFDQRRAGAYHLLMEGIPELLDVIVEAADFWNNADRLLKKPNDPNAERLYFIRYVTNSLYREFGSPMRAATLELTSVFFNCDDIDEAALSRLARPPRARPLSRETSTKMIEQLEQYLETQRDSMGKKDRKELEKTIATARARLNQIDAADK